MPSLFQQRSSTRSAFGAFKSATVLPDRKPREVLLRGGDAGKCYRQANLDVKQVAASKPWHGLLLFLGLCFAPSGLRSAQDAVQPALRAPAERRPAKPGLAAVRDF